MVDHTARQPLRTAEILLPGCKILVASFREGSLYYFCAMEVSGCIRAYAVGIPQGCSLGESRKSSLAAAIPAIRQGLPIYRVA